MYNEFANTLNVGDEVGIVRYNRSYGGFNSARFGTVTKINGHGHIFVDTGRAEPERFDKRGNAYKNDFGPCLIDAGKLRRELAAEEKRKAINNAARELEQAIKGGFNGFGTFFASAERIAELKALVAKIEEIA